MRKRLLCLANSRKWQGRCIAGIDVSTRQWIRPVSDRPTGELSEAERILPGGAEAAPLDVVEVCVSAHTPKQYQTENWTIDSRFPFRLLGRLNPSVLTSLEQTPPSLWLNGHSTVVGENDRMPVASSPGPLGSLLLIRANLSILVRNPYQQRRVVNARFMYRETPYELRITDPLVEGSYLRRPIGRYECGEHYLTLSLGQPFEGHVYKLVAAVIGSATGVRI